MPSPPPAPSVLKIEFVFTLGGDLLASTRIYWQYSGGPPTAAQLTAMAAAIGAAWTPLFGFWLSPNFTLDYIKIEDLSSSTAAVGQHAIGYTGTGGSDEVSVETALLVNDTISRRYRGGRPRGYWPLGLSGLLQGDGVTWDASLTNGYNTNWATFTGLVNALSGYGCVLEQQVNVSFVKGFLAAENPVTGRWRNIPTYRTVDATVDAITSTTARPEISQQRRRRTSTTP